MFSAKKLPLTKLLKKVRNTEGNGKIVEFSVFNEDVKSCKSWYQFLYQKDFIGEPEIFKLNDYCLYEIFDYLKLEDRINLAKTCEKLMNALKSKEKYDEIDLDQETFEDEKKLHSFLDCYASDIKILISNNENFMFGFRSNFLEIVVETCTNLTTIKFYNKDLSRDTLALVSKVTNLRHLSLVHCCLMDSSLLLLSSLKNLESLDMRSITLKQSGQIFPKLQNLKNLNVSECQYIDHNTFLALCIDHPQLITLDMRRSPKLKEGALYALILYCKQIETLKINDHILTDEMLKSFSDLKHLSDLDISHCESFTTKGLLYLMKNSPNLTCINIKSCSQISEKFLVEAIELLKKQSQRIECCKLVTTLEKNENILNRMNNESLILIEFK